MLYTLMLCLLAVSPGWAICCPRYNLHPYFGRYDFSICLDGHKTQGYYCGVGRCNIFSCKRDGGCLSEERIDCFANCLTYALDNRYPVRGCVRACLHNLAEDPLDNGYRSDDRPDPEALAQRTSVTTANKQCAYQNLFFYKILRVTNIF